MAWMASPSDDKEFSSTPNGRRLKRLPIPRPQQGRGFLLRPPLCRGVRRGRPSRAAPSPYPSPTMGANGRVCHSTRRSDLEANGIFDRS